MHHNTNYVCNCTGDSGYPLEPWLLTPFLSPSTPEEVGYNNAHAKTRNVVERCFGVMKSRFRCLDKSGGTLLYTPEKACRIVGAVSVLHNYCIAHNIPTTISPSVIQSSASIQPSTVPQPVPVGQRHSATDLRKRIARQF